MQSILGVTHEDLVIQMAEFGAPAYRADQVFDWVYQKGARSFDEMTNLSFDFRKKLSEVYRFPHWEHEYLTSVDGSRKYRFKLDDGNVIESVWMPEEKRNTLCISSQVGCAMKCAFCVTGAVGFKRNLTADEIATQVWMVKWVEKLALTNVVYMGMGEPLQNLNNVVKSIDILTDKKGMAVGKRRITVSTVGLVPKMREFLAKTDVKLAVSLTGTNDRDRDHWMPINKTYNLKALTDELKSLEMAIGRKITFEVVMLHEKTDSEVQAHELAKILRGIPAKVNLIPYNENPYFPNLKTPSLERVERFRDVLMAQGVFAVVRKNRGTDIMGACGQLAGEKT